MHQENLQDIGELNFYYLEYLMTYRDRIIVIAETATKQL